MKPILSCKSATAVEWKKKKSVRKANLFAIKNLIFPTQIIIFFNLQQNKDCNTATFCWSVSLQQEGHGFDRKVCKGFLCRLTAYF